MAALGEACLSDHNVGRGETRTLYASTGLHDGLADAREPLCGSGLTIGPCHDDPLVVGRTYAEGEGEALEADVASRMGREGVVEIGVLKLEAFEDILRVVGRSRVDHDDLKAVVVLLEDCRQMTAQGFGLIVGDNDNGKGGEGFGDGHQLLLTLHTTTYTAIAIGYDHGQQPNEEDDEDGEFEQKHRWDVR